MDRRAKDIARYLSGHMTAQEKHALEKDALTDPFLADALDGAEDIVMHSWEKDLSTLKKRLKSKISDRNEKEKKSIFWTYRIAASILFLAACTWGIYQLLRSTAVQNERLALSPKSEETEPSNTADSVSISTDTSQRTITPQQPPRPSPPKKIFSEPQSGHKPEMLSYNDHVGGTSKPTEQPHPAPVITEDDISTPLDPSFENEAKEDLFSEEMIVIDMTHNKSERMATKKRKRSSQDEENVKTAPSSPEGFSQFNLENVPRIVSGIVTDADDGLPIPGVNVMVEGTSNGTTTNLDGEFELEYSENDHKLLFSFTGLESKEVDISRQENLPLSISMQPDVSALGEIIVIGYAEKDASFDGVKWDFAEPEGGKKDYQNYLKKNLVYPEQAIENQIEGKVSVQFYVQTNGQLSDLRVVKSIGYGCDEELIRLIRQGPNWKPTKRNDIPVLGRGKVKMKFSLPK